MSPVLKTYDLRLAALRYDYQFYKIRKTNWNAIQLEMSPYLRLIPVL